MKRSSQASACGSKGNQKGTPVDTAESRFASPPNKRLPPSESKGFSLLSRVSRLERHYLGISNGTWPPETRILDRSHEANLRVTNRCGCIGPLSVVRRLSHVSCFCPFRKEFTRPGRRGDRGGQSEFLQLLCRLPLITN